MNTNQIDTPEEDTPEEDTLLEETPLEEAPLIENQNVTLYDIDNIFPDYIPVEFQYELDFQNTLEDLLDEALDQPLNIPDNFPKNIPDNDHILADEAYIIWLKLNPFNKIVETFESPYREELEKAYRDLKFFHIIEELNCAYIFDVNNKFMQIPLNYYTNNSYNIYDIKYIKRISVLKETRNKYISIYNSYWESIESFIIEDSINNINIIKINIAKHPNMYVKDVMSDFSIIWEYTKSSKNIPFNKIYNWTLFSQEIIDKIEQLYENRNILPSSGKILPTTINLNSKIYKIQFNINCNYAKMYDNNNIENIYILRCRIKDTIDINHMYARLLKDNSYDGLCPICLDTFTDSYTYNSILLKCNHRFHILCIQCVANMSDTYHHKCPMCRDIIDWNLYPDITKSKCTDRHKYRYESVLHLEL